MLHDFPSHHGCALSQVGTYVLYYLSFYENVKIQQPILHVGCIRISQVSGSIHPEGPAQLRTHRLLMLYKAHTNPCPDRPRLAMHYLAPAYYKPAKPIISRVHTLYGAQELEQHTPSQLDPEHCAGSPLNDNVHVREP